MAPEHIDKPFEAGTHWMPDRGKLYRFTDHGVVVIRPWPNPQAWRKYEGGRWLPAAPRIELQVDDTPCPPHLLNRNSGCTGEQKAWITIPAEVRRAVTDAHFAGYQWPALSMMARCPGAIDLANEVPMLAAMLSVGNRLRNQPVGWLLRSIRALLKTPDGWSRWSRVCRWLDLDDSRSFIRMVRKTELHSFGWRLDHWKPILRTWNHPRGVKLLRHTPRIVEAHGTLLNVAFMHLGMDMSLEILRPSLFGEIAEDAGIFLPELLLETLILGWNIVWPHRRIPPIMSIEHLERLRGEVTEAYFRFAEQRCQRNLLNQLNIDTENIDQDTLERLKRFPPAPLIGVPGLITPLDSPEALKTEGTEMGHCLGNNSWFHLSRARMGYAYAITQAGERATVWLTRDEHKSPGFRVEQIRGPHNLPVSPKVTDLIFAWLDEHSAWVRHRELDRPPPSLSLLEAEPDALPEEWGTPPPLAHLRPADPVLFDHDIPF